MNLRLRLLVPLVVACVWGAAANVSAQQVHSSNGRFRIGLEGGAGLAFGDTEGAAVGVLGQLGAQVSDLFAIYYQPTLYFMGFGNSANSQGIVGTGQGGMLVLDPSQFFELGLGGGYFFGDVGNCSSTSTTCTTGSFGGAMVNARVAFIIGFDLIRARLGIPISINTQTIFNGSQRITTVIAAIGLQRY